jgi:nitrogen regulatory protein PII
MYKVEEIKDLSLFLNGSSVFIPISPRKIAVGTSSSKINIFKLCKDSKNNSQDKKKRSSYTPKFNLIISVKAHEKQGEIKNLIFNGKHLAAVIDGEVFVYNKEEIRRKSYPF